MSAGREAGHRRRVDASRERRAYLDVAAQPEPHRLVQDSAQPGDKVALVFDGLEALWRQRPVALRRTDNAVADGHRSPRRQLLDPGEEGALVEVGVAVASGEEVVRRRAIERARHLRM